jgi:hypothetical protein
MNNEHMKRFDNSKFSSNPILVTPPKKKFVIKKKVIQKPTPKQYGDKGYTPSNGIGVGY